MKSYLVASAFVFAFSVFGRSSAFAGWGAIAYGGAHIVGYSSGYDSLESARQAALDSCPARWCRIVSTENNSCAAFATGSSDARGQTSGYTSRDRAIFDAIKTCGVTCEMRAWVCN